MNLCSGRNTYDAKNHVFHSLGSASRSRFAEACTNASERVVPASSCSHHAARSIDSEWVTIKIGEAGKVHQAKEYDDPFPFLNVLYQESLGRPSKRSVPGFSGLCYGASIYGEKWNMFLSLFNKLAERNYDVIFNEWKMSDSQTVNWHLSCYIKRSSIDLTLFPFFP